MKNILYVCISLLLLSGIFFNVLKFQSSLQNYTANKSEIKKKKVAFNNNLNKLNDLKNNKLLKVKNKNTDYKKQIYDIINKASNSKKKFFEIITISSPNKISKYEQKSINILSNLSDELLFYVFNHVPFTFYSQESKNILNKNESIFSIDYSTIQDTYKTISSSEEICGMYNTSPLYPKYSNILLMSLSPDIKNSDDNLENTLLHEFAHALYFSETANSDIDLKIKDKKPFNIVLSKHSTATHIITTYEVVDYYLTNKEECFAELFSWQFSKNNNANTIYKTYKKKYPNDTNYQQINKLIDKIKKENKLDKYNYADLYLSMLEKKINAEINLSLD